MTMYQMTYIINNLFMTYVLYRFLMIFFDSRKTGRIVELTFYCMYFVIISATVFFPTPPLFYMNILAMEMPAAPAPLITILRAPLVLPVTFRALMMAALVMMAVPCWSSWPHSHLPPTLSVSL